MEIMMSETPKSATQAQTEMFMAEKAALHQPENVGSGLLRYRVRGGFMYCYTSSSGTAAVFVPFHDQAAELAAEELRERLANAEDTIRALETRCMALQDELNATKAPVEPTPAPAPQPAPAPVVEDTVAEQPAAALPAEQLEAQASAAHEAAVGQGLPAASQEQLDADEANTAKDLADKQ